MTNWFVVQTNPARENFVEEHLADFEPYLPKFKSTTGRVRPLFPSYLFVKAVEFWSPIKNCVGVRTLLMMGDRPATIPHDVIRDWQGAERNGLVQLPDPPRYRAGEKLVVARGTLRYKTVLHTGLSSRDREFVLTDMLGAMVRISIATADLVAENERHTIDRLPRRRENYIPAYA